MISLLEDCFSDRESFLGKYNEKFSKNYRKQYLDIFSKNFSLFDRALKAEDYKLIKEKLQKLFKTNENLKKISAGMEKLETFSKWLGEFRGEEDLEVPGQYGGKGEPNLKGHVRVAGFDGGVLVLESLRR